MIIRGGPFGEEKGTVWLDAGPEGRMLQIIDYYTTETHSGWSDDEIRFYMPPGPQHLSGLVRVVRADGTQIDSALPLVCSAYVSHLDKNGGLTTAGGSLTVNGFDLCPPEVPGITGTDVYSIWYVQAHYVSPWTGITVSEPALLVTPLPAVSVTDTAVEFDVGGWDPDGDGKVPVEVSAPWGDESAVIEAELIPGGYHFFLWTGALGEGSPQQMADSGIFSEAYSVYVQDAD